MKTIFYTVILILTTVSLLGCATVPFLKDRITIAEDIADKAGFTKEYIRAGGFALMTYQKFSRTSKSIVIYIEGDGRAWETKYELSNDPTPSNPMALRLAVEDPAGNIAYIARPGQYPLRGIPDCDSKYWSGFRFADEVINAYSMAIDVLKEKSLAQNVELVGYSGGGALAVLVADRRGDVVALRTVAGNLDIKAFCRFHDVSPLEGSMDPMDVAQKISIIPQRHFVGSKDLVVPGFIIHSFVTREGDQVNDRITIVEGATHSKGWLERWKKLLSLPLLKV